MRPPTTYRHFCATAQALDVVGERWALLVVRDLLAGEQRFTDLQRSLTGITPKQLTTRLRALEQAGIVERAAGGRGRQIPYRLTEAGRDLGPVVDALAAWSLTHVRRPPQPGERVHPRHVMSAYVTALNRHRANTGRPCSWNVRFSSGEVWALRCDGRRWTSEPGEVEGAGSIETTPEAWAEFLTASPENALMLAESIGPADEDAPLSAETAARTSAAVPSAARRGR